MTLLPWVESIGRDIRLGLRMLRKNAGVTAAAVVSLSLSLGACVSAFALVDALILRPLHVRQPEQLVYVTFSDDGPGRPEAETFNDPLVVQLRDVSRGHVDLFAMSTQVIRPLIFDGGTSASPAIRRPWSHGCATRLAPPRRSCG